MTIGPTPALASPFAGLSDWVLETVETLGYAGIAAFIALESVFPPIPSELILPLAGFLAGQGRFWLPAVILAATIGSVAGALALYAAGAWLGDQRLARLVDRFGRVVGVRASDLERANDWFDRHGDAAVLLGRLVPVVRSLVSVPAGVRRMPLPRFAMLTAVGSTAWNAALVTLGWALGERWESVERYASIGQWLIVAAGVVVAGRWIVRRRAAFRNGDARERSAGRFASDDG